MKAAVIAGVVVLATASGFAMAQVSDQSSAPIVLAQVNNPDQGPSTTVSAEQRKKLQEEAAAKRAAGKPAKEKKTLAEKRKEAKTTAPLANPEQGTTGMTAEERAKFQAEAKAKREANAKMTPAERKAAANERGKAAAAASKTEKAQ